MAFIDTALKLDDVAVGTNHLVVLGDTQIALIRNKEGLFALDNLCPHRGAPLHEGFVSDGQVSCPWHQWQFQLEDGVCRNIPNVRIATFPVEVRDGNIWIELED